MANWIVTGPFYQLLTASSGSWQVPATYYPEGSKVECIGRGGNGGSSSSGGSGGGGGAYTAVNNPVLTPGSWVNYTVGTSSNVTSTNFAGICDAKNGSNGSSTSGGAGGVAATTGDVRYRGGNGRNRVSTSTGGDGGDAASAAGAGSNGSWAGSGIGEPGVAGTQWGIYGGSGTGGKSRDASAGNGNGGAGGAFGGGGGGGRGTGGAGAPGAILVTHHSLDLELAANEFAYRIPGTGNVSWTVPANCFSIKEVHVTGPGGNAYDRMGGSGGAFAAKLNVAVTPGQTISGYIGAGGSGVDSWFISSTTLKAAAGQSGGDVDGNPSPPASASIGDVVFRGGRGGGYSDRYTKSGRGGGGAAGSFTGNGGGGGDGAATSSSWNGGNGGSANSGGAGGARGATDEIGSPGASDPRGGGGGGGGGYRAGGNGGFPGGGGGGSGGIGADGTILVIYTIGSPQEPAFEPTHTVELMPGTTFLASYAVTYPNARQGTDVTVSEYGWIGQYQSSEFEVNQVMAGFATNAFASISEARLVLTVQESFGLTLEVREHDWTAASISSFVPGDSLASKNLLASVAIEEGFTGEISIPVSAFALDGSLKLILCDANQTAGVAPTGDDTMLVSNARLELIAVADTTAPTISSPATASVAENTVNPTGSLTANEPVTWTISGGADASSFSVSGSTWTLNATPDFETKTSYAVTFRATDAAGNFSNQNFTLTITDVDETPPSSGGSPWTPSDLSNKLLWIDCSDTTTITFGGYPNVDRYADKSAAGRNLNVEQPPSYVAGAINGLAASYWYQDRMAFSEIASGTTLSAFFAFKGETPQTLMTLMGNMDAMLMPIAASNSATNTEVFRGATVPAIRKNGLSTVWANRGDAHASMTDPNTQVLVWQNFTLQAPLNRFGAAPFSYYFRGHVGEVVFVQGDPSSSDVERIEGYLAHKWGTVSSLPADHPYKTAAPVNAPSGERRPVRSSTVQ